ncbi:MAG: peptidase S8, partial [Cyanobacteria bacterium P01_C01_bin.73]
MTQASSIILQRGGEELLLVKLSDRFTTPGLSEAAQQALSEQIRPQRLRPVAAGRLLEWTLLPRRLDSVMAQVRQQPEIRFTS